MRPKRTPDKSATEYQFTRNGVAYACVAKPSVDRSDEMQWTVTVDSIEYRGPSYSGEEFTTRNDRAAFEDELIDAVLVRTHELDETSDPASQVLRMSELRPGRLLEHRDGREGRVAEVDPLRQRVLFEIRGTTPVLVWTPIADVQLSRQNKLFVKPRGFQVR